MSKWYVEYKCVKCDASLSIRERIYSDGCCPHCGNTIDSTFVDTKKETVQRPSDIRVAWTLTKLRWVRALLAPILKWHIRQEAKKTNKLDK